MQEAEVAGAEAATLSHQAEAALRNAQLVRHYLTPDALQMSTASCSQLTSLLMRTQTSAAGLPMSAKPVYSVLLSMRPRDLYATVHLHQN